MNTENELITDDDLLREQAMCDGPKRASKFTLRPVTAVSLSWMLRNDVLEKESGDPIQRNAAFAYLHSVDKKEIRAVVNNREEFMDAVDQWMDENVSHHRELEAVSAEKDTALDRYMAATTLAAHSNNAPGVTIKN